jgi:5-methylcytosine-specific restriction endonuclease McrA
MAVQAVPRSMAEEGAVRAYWYSAQGLRDVEEFVGPDWSPPSRGSCWACRTGRGGLERGHLVDHARGGAGTPDNLVPLCWECNRIMPSFGPGDILPEGPRPS